MNEFIIVLIITLIIFVSERYMRKLSKTPKGRNSIFHRIWCWIERPKKMDCICGKGGRIYVGHKLGLISFGLPLLILPYFLIIWGILEGTNNNLLSFIAIFTVVIFIKSFGAYSMYKKMMGIPHSSKCTKRAVFNHLMYDVGPIFGPEVNPPK